MDFESLVHHLNPGPTYISSATPSFVHPSLALLHPVSFPQRLDLVDLSAMQQLKMSLPCSIRVGSDSLVILVRNCFAPSLSDSVDYYATPVDANQRSSIMDFPFSSTHTSYCQSLTKIARFLAKASLVEALAGARAMRPKMSQFVAFSVLHAQNSFSLKSFDLSHSLLNLVNFGRSSEHFRALMNC